MNSLQKLTVEDAYKLEMTTPVLVQKEENLTQVIHRFTELPESTGNYVVDEKNRLIGVITRRDLLDWARIQVGTGLWLIEDRRLIKIIMASTAGEIIHPGSRRAIVRPHDTLDYALHLMIELDLICLPVLDDTDQIIGDLKLMEILSCIIKTIQGEENVK